MKIAIIADLHLNVKNRHFFQYIKKSIDNLCKELENHRIDKLCIAGDVFHTKGTIEIESLLESNNVIIKQFIEKFDTYFIPGNHDLIYKDYNKTKFNILNNYSTVTDNIFNEYTYKDFDNCRFHFIPYNKKIQFNKCKMSETNKNILISHFGVNTFEYDNSMVDNESQIEVDNLKTFDQVFLGHYHGYQTKNNVTYVSSPYQQKHGDEDSEHGFVIYDTDSNTFEFFKNTKTIDHKTVFLTKPSDLIELKNTKNSILRVILKKNFDSNIISALREKLLKNNISVSIKTEIDNVKINNSAVIDEWKNIIYEDTDSLLTQFLDVIVPNYDYSKEEFLYVLKNEVV